MAAPIAAIIARQALSKFGDQLPAGVKEVVGLIDNPKAAVQGIIRNEIKDRIKEEILGGQDSQLEEGRFGYGRPDSDFSSLRGEGGGGKPQFDEQGMSVTAFKRGGKVKAKSASSRADGIAKRGKTRGRYL